MKRIATLVVGLALLVAPSSALAQSSTCQAYNPETCSVSTVSTTSTGDANDGTLPFTGIDVALLAVGGGGLLGTGMAVRRLSRRLN